MRVVLAWRRALPWIAGVLVAAIRSGSVELVAPGRCGGLLELVSIASVTLNPTLAIGTLFAAMHAVAIGVAVGSFVELARLASGDLAIGVAAGLAVGLGPLFPSTLAPPWEAAAFAVSATGALALAKRRTRYAIAAFAACALLFVLIVPPSRIGACLRPAWTSVPRTVSFADDLRTIAFVLGPLTVALAIFGAWCTWGPASAGPSPNGPPKGGPYAIFALVALAVMTLSSAAPQIAWAPALVAVWLLAALGLREITTLMGRAGWQRMGAMALLVLVPLLQISRRASEERDDRVPPIGHERVRFTDVRAILDVVSTGAAFAEEDAAVDTLLRASVFGGRRASKPFTVVPRTREAVRQAVAAGAAYAWPRGQQDLANRGFTFAPVEAPHQSTGNGQTVIGGIAQVAGVRSCVDVEDRSADITGALASGRVTLAADSESARGPALLLIGGATPAAVAPDNWPLRVMRGYHARSFEGRDELGADRVAAMAQEFGLPASHPLLAHPFIVRLELHRTPRAPLTLPVMLGGRMANGVARLNPSAVREGRLSICDAPPIAVAAFGS